ncbi:histidine kinase [Corallococcus sp. H22C18031201]|uniref:PAS domain S-box protein n=1 Tax=Citreicoccus inhibens TaxID=2849499 RepID=UPI000E71910D|nr:PAS domain S-box protein [Citreicoccus inhibens]MBU8898036.1 PAS domain S-box protein [Citreicoccus inhibens]RJS15768.1 histidine kinase [Corallococcus sp. H22C18031201]
MPSSSESAFGIVLVPPSSAAREPLSEAAGRAGLHVVDSPDDAALALVDLTAPGCGPAVVELLTSFNGPHLTLLALVDPGERGFAAVETLRPADILTPQGLSSELTWRLQRAAERHREREEQARSQTDLALLLELTADYAESSDVEALLHGVTRRLAEKLDIARATLVMLGGSPGEGVIVAASDDPALKDLRIELARYPEIREVVRTGKPVVMQEAATHPLLGDVERRAVAARGIHAIAALPLPIRGEVRGVLLLRAAGRRRAFSPREIDFLTTVAHATAVALRNASVLQKVRGQTEAEKTARLAAEEKAASFKPYQLFFAHVSEGVAILDDKACVLSLNPSGAAMLDLPAAEARGRHLHQVTQPVDDGVLMELVTSAARGEARSGVDVVVRTAAGRCLTLSMSAAPLRDEDAATILSFRDVTHARKLEDELRQTKDFLERLIDSSVDAIIAADLKGRIILYNKGAEAMCGFSAQEALAHLTVEQLYPPGVARRIMAQLRSQEHGGRGRLSLVRQELVHRTGERVPVNMTASIVYEGGRESFSVGIFTDLRDRVQLERKLSDVETRLEESEKSAVIVALAGTAAHELNQPLTSVMGYAELLKRKLKEEDFAYRPVDIIYREAERMAEIVRKIGKITRYETKSYVGAQQILDLDKATSHEE